jgi:AcrR family transcriptional regulator
MSPSDEENGTLIWSRLGQSGRGRQPSLTHQAIADAAVEIADADGLDAVSMRRVARALNVGTMSLYRYLASRDDLIDLMNDRILAELTAQEFDRTSWRHGLLQLARTSRQLYLRHEWAAWSLGGRPALGPNMIDWIERIYALVDQPALSVDQMMDMVGTVIAFVRGVVQAEIVELQVERATGLNDQDWRNQVAPYVIELLETEDHPYFKRIVIEAEDFPEPDVVFERRLGYIIDGLAVGLGLTD